MNTERAVFVYTTYPSLVEAERAGRALVEKRLCACVNILPGMVSHYWWNGAIERGEEVVMIIKTRALLTAKVLAADGAASSAGPVSRSSKARTGTTGPSAASRIRSVMRPTGLA